MSLFARFRSLLALVVSPHRAFALACIITLCAPAVRAQDLFVANLNGANVLRIPPSGVQSVFATGVGGPTSVAFSGSGDLYVANFTGNAIVRVTPGGIVSPFATGFNTPYYLAVNGAGDLFVSNRFSNTINRVTPGGIVSNFVTVPGSPGGLAFDAGGNLYVVNQNNGVINRVTPGDRLRHSQHQPSPGVRRVWLLTRRATCLWQTKAATASNASRRLGWCRHF